MDNDQGTVAVPDFSGETQQPTVQSPDVQTDSVESGAQSTFAELAAKKGFNSPDDLAKAYANLESHNTKVAQGKAELESLFFQQAQPQGQPQPELQGDALQELDKFVNERFNPQLQAVKQEFEEKIARMELRSLMEKNPDFGKFANDVKDLKGKHPTMSFEEALQFAKATKGATASEARSEGIKQSVQALQRQGAAQVAPEKRATEKSGGLAETLGTRFKTDAQGRITPSERQRMQAIEQEIFGQVLDTTTQGI